jgi:xanthosine utilization system XapX-like protein
MSYLADIIAVKDLLLISLGTGFLIGFVYMIFLRLCGGPIIYITILLTIVSSGAGSFMLYDMSQQMCGLKGDFK